MGLSLTFWREFIIGGLRIGLLKLTGLIIYASLSRRFLSDKQCKFIISVKSA